MSLFLDRWCVVGGKNNPSHCILMLAGRSQSAQLLPTIYWYGGLKNLFHNRLIVGLATQQKAWYPIPKGAEDQEQSLLYMPYAISLVENAVKKIYDEWGIPKRNIVILGFSAGGVMAVQIGAHSKKAYAGIICQSGAILSPKSLPTCRHPQTPILLTHSRDDEGFEWYERYLPMKKALLEKKYNLTVCENPFGGHNLTELDIISTLLFIERCFS